MGLDEFNGRPVGDNLEAQMKLEFHRDGLKWSAPNYGIQTNGKDEWEFVVQPIAGKWYPGQNISGNFRKRSTNLQELLNLDLTYVVLLEAALEAGGPDACRGDCCSALYRASLRRDQQGAPQARREPARIARPWEGRGRQRERGREGEGGGEGFGPVSRHVLRL
eukprot:198991-Rhodomonas_salina.2